MKITLQKLFNTPSTLTNATTRRISLLACILSVLSASAASAQVTFNSLSDTYNADFGVPFLASAPQPWTDNSTIAGWWGRADNAAATVYNVSTGSNGSDGLMAYSATFPNPSGAEAFGSLNSGSGGGNLLAVQLFNNTGAEITEVDVSFTQLQWYGGNGGANDSWTAAYRLGGTVPTGGVYTTVSALDVDNLSSGGGALPTPISQNVAGSITGLSWADGDSLWIRWVDSNVSGGDAGAGFSAMSISVVPEPSTTAFLLGSAMLGLVFLRRRFSK